jgi:putative transposase
MTTKSQQIKNSLAQTREKRKSQTCKVFELKLVDNQLNKLQKEFLKRIFLESKWLYNDILACMI